MGRLRNSDLLRVLEFVRSIEAARGLPEFRAAAFAGLRQLVPYDIASYNEVEPATGSAVIANDPPGALNDVYDGFLAFMQQHPVIAHVERTGDPSARKISDFLTQREFRRLDLYDAVFRPHGLRHQIAITLPAPPPLVIGIALNSTRRDFVERERELLELVRPHLGQAYRNAELRELTAALTEDSPRGARAVVMLTPSGRIRAATANAERLLGRYFGDRPRPGGGLPDTVSEWFARQSTRPSTDELAPREPLVAEREFGRLCVRLVPGRFADRPDLLIMDERCLPLSDSTLAFRGLTRREREILRLAARGLTNPEIAQELFVSPRTVQKHLEHICEKLEVRTRTAAVTRAFELSAAA